MGEFEEGKMHGFGMVFFKNGERYEGMVKNNKMQGKGTESNFKTIDLGMVNTVGDVGAPHQTWLFFLCRYLLHLELWC